MPEMPDFDEIMKMAQNAQAELQKAQDNLDKIEVEGAAGGGLVKIRATAKGRILGVDIDESLLAAVREDDARGSDRRRDQRRPRPRPTPPPREEMQKMQQRPAAAARVQAALLSACQRADFRA